MNALHAPLTSSEAAALSKNVTQKVIVVFKNQVSQYPASRSLVGLRRRAESQDQHAVLGELGETKARHVHSYTCINAVAATVSPGEEARLKANPAVAEVVPDQIIHLAEPFDAPRTSASPSTTTGTHSCSPEPARPTADRRCSSLRPSRPSTPTRPIPTPRRPARSASTARA